jgi:hypothetical protein
MFYKTIRLQVLATLLLTLAAWCSDVFDEGGSLGLNVWLATEQASSELVVAPNQDIRDAVRRFALSKKLPPIREQYLTKCFLNMDLQRSSAAAIVKTWSISLADGNAELTVRFGSDLQLLAQTFGSEHGIEAEDTLNLAKLLKEYHPENTSPQWCASRVAATAPLPPSQRQCQHPPFAAENCVTIAITTCKRLGLFEKTIRALVRDSVAG